MRSARLAPASDSLAAAGVRVCVQAARQAAPGVALWRFPPHHPCVRARAWARGQWRSPRGGAGWAHLSPRPRRWGCCPWPPSRAARCSPRGAAPATPAPPSSCRKGEGGREGETCEHTSSRDAQLVNGGERLGARRNATRKGKQRVWGGALCSRRARRPPLRRAPRKTPHPPLAEPLRARPRPWARRKPRRGARRAPEERRRRAVEQGLLHARRGADAAVARAARAQRHPPPTFPPPCPRVSTPCAPDTRRRRCARRPQKWSKNEAAAKRNKRKGLPRGTPNTDPLRHKVISAAVSVRRALTCLCGGRIIIVARR